MGLGQHEIRGQPSQLVRIPRSTWVERGQTVGNWRGTRRQDERCYRLAVTASADLFEAIRTGDLGAVDQLLATRPYLAGSSNSAGLTAVTAAAYAQQPAIVERILAAKPELDRFEAAIVGDLARLSELLDEADSGPIDQRSADGFSALHLAAFFGRLRAAQELLDRGADPNVWAAGDLRVQALHSAVAGGHEAVARLLLAHGAQPDQPQRGGYTPFTRLPPTD